MICQNKYTECLFYACFVQVWFILWVTPKVKDVSVQIVHLENREWEVFVIEEDNWYFAFTSYCFDEVDYSIIESKHEDMIVYLAIQFIRIPQLELVLFELDLVSK